MPKLVAEEADIDRLTKAFAAYPGLDHLRVRRRADLLVIEGVMGLFDGADAAVAPPGRRGTTADLAAHFNLPVLLVLDVARQAQSAAALVRGFATHDAGICDVAAGRLSVAIA